MSAPVSSIAILGNGIAAWTAAATLRRRIRGARVTVVRPAAPASAISDRIASLPPSAIGFHLSIGLEEDEVARAIHPLPWLATRFTGFGSAPFTLGHGRYGPAARPAAFHHLWLRTSAPAADYARHSAAAMLAHAGRLPPDAPLDAPLGGIEQGLAVDPSAYRAYLRAYARHLGATEAPTPFASADTAGDRIAGLTLADDSTIAADLFVDASGEEALLLSRLETANWCGWTGWLPDARLTIGDAPPSSPRLMDEASATREGWRLTVPLADRTRVATTGREPLANATTHPLAQGRRRRSWIGNCVGVGEAAVITSPLFGAPHHLLQRACERIVALMPDADFAAVELALYNREFAEEADRVRDTLALLSGAPLPEEIARSVALFRERGRIVQRDREMLAPDQLVALMIGLDIRPARPDALASEVDTPTAAAFVAAHADAVAAAVAGATPSARAA